MTGRQAQVTRYCQRCSRKAANRLQKTSFKKAKNLYEMEKHYQSQRNWFENTSSLNMEKDTQKLWQLTKALNDDSVFRSQTVLLTGKAACNVLANAYKNVSEVEISRSTIHVIQRDTKELQNIDVPSEPCTFDR